ncbi:MAG: ribonuclease P protein component [Candidatus Dadabacteria bacterium]|nr:MAG: ribonuclease P protein component [Candidatus Dadabacteria bacterium]
MGSGRECEQRVDERCLTPAAPRDASALLYHHHAKGIIAKRADYSFPARLRIKKKKDFARVEKEGRKLYSRHFLVAVLPNRLEYSRLGLVVTRKVNKRASARNLLKRRLRELFRLERHQLADNFDIVIVARQNADQCNFADIKREILGALYHNNLLKSSGKKQCRDN